LPLVGGEAIAAAANDEGEFSFVVGLGGVDGRTMGSPGPMIAEGSFMNTTGVLGRARPDSMAWSR